jgi:hypothetical protein
MATIYVGAMDAVSDAINKLVADRTDGHVTNVTDGAVGIAAQEIITAKRVIQIMNPMRKKNKTFSWQQEIPMQPLLKNCLRT